MLLRLLPLGLFILLTGCTLDAEGKRRPFSAYLLSWPKEGPSRPAPPTRGLDSAGRALRLEDQRGKVVLLSFWFSDCPPCRALMPHEKKLVDTFPPDRFVLMGINADADLARLRSMESKAQLNYRSIADGNQGPVCTAWGVTSFPTFVLIDADGNVRWRHDGPADPAELEGRIAQLLKERPAAVARPASR
ncbi:MAG: TlpA disulfide reductase family protein [Gemmataceae bacterium]